ncbi:MAG: UPF0182 family membrane protein [Candidatus Longimicrobiales bacterium M2_2A_002]
MANFEFPGRDASQGGNGINLSDLDLSRLDRFIVWGVWAIGLFLLWLLVSWGQGFYTDWLWFRGVGHEDVLITTTVAQVALYVAALLIFLALALPNLYLAWRATGGTPALPEGLSAQDYDFARKLLVRTGAGILFIMGLLFASGPAAEWETALLFLNRVPFGETEPIFGLDFGFFIFTLPALELVRVWLLSALGTVALVVAGYYYLTSRIRNDRFSFSGEARTQLVLLGAALFVVLAAGHWLSRYELLYSPTGAVYGVGFTDDNVNLPGRAILTVIALGAAVTLAYGAFRNQGKKILIWPVAVWGAAVLLIGSVAPSAVQRLQVEPSELAREREYLANNIQYTRQAFGLDQLQSRSHPALGNVGREIIAENQGTIQNVRLWDESPLLQSYNQIQFFRLYYDFLAVHTDRYTVNGELRQVMLATRELSAEKLPDEAQRWVNRRLQFTHGYGVAMSPVTEVRAGGRPTFFVSDVPPEGEIPLERPEVYYGLKSLEYAITSSGMQEFNYPGIDGPVYTSYQGEGGVALSSFFRRLMYAWEFQDLNILISGEINEDSRIQYRRTVPDRFSTITPFLLRDREAYSVVADDRLFWIQDAYTVTTRYPYSTSFNGRFNYIRNSVKAVVNAYDGSIDFYVFDPDDPLVQAYQNIFPELFTPAEEMPDYLRRHVRVPLDQFTVQTQMLLEYHMRDPVVFYNKEDQWSIPVQNSFGRSQALEPYYIVARLPGEETEEFLLIQPFTPNNRHNLVGWMAARSDGDAYGELVLFDFPAGRHVDGPNQVEARIDNDPIISEQFTLWGQVGSEVSRGILLVIPLGDAILYAEPIFLTPEALAFPELRRIILADADDVVMHTTLESSVDALVGKLPAVALPAEEAAVEAGQEESTVRGETLEMLRSTLEDAVDGLRRALETIREMEADTVP